MAEVKLPYVNAYGNITKALDGIKRASTPDRFTQDFLGTKLGLKGGSARPLIPFLKRTGFLQSDGTPTDLYRRFRNEASAGAAAAEAMRIGYKPLYEINEYVHDASDEDLKGVIVQATGADAGSRVVRSVLGSFKAVRAFADFDAAEAAVDRGSGEDAESGAQDPGAIGVGSLARSGIALGYTINLHLPATSDIAVFNAIFKSLREHLLR